MSSSFSPRRSLRSAAMASAVVLSMLIVPTVVSADEGQQEHAEQLFAEGREYFEQSEYSRAADNFLEAYEILDAPELLYNIGQAYRRAGDLVSAERYFQKYLNETSEAPNEDEVAETIIELQQQLAARKATIELDSDPAGATVSVDDADQQCETPCTLELVAGDYTLTVELEDHETATRDIELDLEEETSESFNLQEKLFFGNLVVNTDVTGATLQIGDDRHDLPHGDPLEVESGDRTLALEWDGETITHDVEIPRDETLQLFVPLEESAGGDFSPLRASALGLGGASVALAAAATWSGLQARTTHSDLEAQQEETGAADPDLIASGRRQQRAANILWVGAAATLGAGAGLWTFDWYRDRDDSPELQPTQPADPADDEESDDTDDEEPEIDIL